MNDIKGTLKALGANGAFIEGVDSVRPGLPFSWPICSGRKPANLGSTFLFLTIVLKVAHDCGKGEVLGKAWELAQPRRRTHGAEPYDLVIVDAPATGHGVGILKTPRMFSEIARVGPIAHQGHTIAETIADRDFTGDPRRLHSRRDAGRRDPVAARGAAPRAP